MSDGEDASFEIDDETNADESDDMNKEQIENLWEACRDGSISESDRAAFERHLRENESAAAMWEAESQWLTLMSDVDGAFAQEPTARDGQAFAMSVLDDWQAQSEREELGVIATIKPATTAPLRRYASIAAVIALLVGAAIYVASITPTPGGTPNNGGNVAVVPPVDGDAPKRADTAPQAIGLLLASAKENYAVAAAQPGRLRQGFADTAALLDVGRLASLLDPGVPDPLEFVSPGNGG